jgi:hypothetical protein
LGDALDGEGHGIRLLGTAITYGRWQGVGVPLPFRSSSG